MAAATTTTKSVALVVTSHREIRLGPQVASLVTTLLQSPAESANIKLKPVDVKSFGLPVYNETVPPVMVKPGGAQFQQETSRAWAAEMSSHDGYIFLVNEYNYGMSGATKNAIDYLYHGFAGKPVMIVSYGARGGRIASEQVGGVLSAMGLTVVEPTVKLAFSGGRGPDGFLAVNEGKIGDDTRAEWLGKGDEIVKAFEELGNELRKDRAEEGTTQPMPKE